MFVDLDAEFHILKVLFEDFLPKIIKGAGNCESLILRAKVVCLKFGGTHGIIVVFFYSFLSKLPGLETRTLSKTKRYVFDEFSIFAFLEKTTQTGE